MIKAPSADKILTKKDFNDNGILVVIKNGTYHIGETYFNETYQKIANRGGNNNGIGIEMCINEGENIYLNYQILAKLCAQLMDQNHLEIKDILPHHYFSGKDCPMTMRKNQLWEHFLKLVEVEYQVLTLKKAGYIITLEPISTNITKQGLLKDLNSEIRFIIKTKKDNVIDSYEYHIKNTSC